ITIYYRPVGRPALINVGLQLPSSQTAQTITPLLISVSSTGISQSATSTEPKPQPIASQERLRQEHAESVLPSSKSEREQIPRSDGGALSKQSPKSGDSVESQYDQDQYMREPDDSPWDFSIAPRRCLLEREPGAITLSRSLFYSFTRYPLVWHYRVFVSVIFHSLTAIRSWAMVDEDEDESAAASPEGTENDSVSVKGSAPVPSHS
ncbi:hypothetical protein BVRB_030420, partial [Beta vulgaris subsp. vulgaris]